MKEFEELGNQEILESYFQGNNDLAGVLLERLWASLVPCARTVVADFSRSQKSEGINLDAEEATNQTLTEFMEARAREKNPFQDFNWLHLIRYLRNRVVLRIRDQNRKWSASRRLGGQIISFEDVSKWVDDDDESKPFDPPSSSNEETEAFHKFNRCMERIQPAEREMFQRKHLDETTQAELALNYSMPQGTLAVRLMRIAARLRDCLKRSGVTTIGRVKL
jgi:RNA polymerase sigma factor (sigma-70 family)